MDGSYIEAPPRRRIGGPLVAVAIAFLAGIALAAFAAHRWVAVSAWLHPLPPPVASASPPPVPLAVAAPAAPLVDSALAARVDALAERIAAIDQRSAQASGDATRAEGLLVAFAARRALDRGQPLGFLEGMLRQRFAADAQSVAMIVGAAQRPVTLPQLQDRLAALAPALAAAPADAGWWTTFRREMKGLFVVRRADVPAAPPADRLTRAEHALEAGQVDLALAEIARLPASPAANGWIASARRYVLARNALDRIETAALLAPPAAPAPSVAD